ncbi:MAG: DUF3575 domain-containing protein [Bacteroidales bacterium]|nr:DUF3575 domain-containing protein [Bacteroidales bacterium]
MRRTAILTVVSIFMSLGIAYSQENVLHRRDTVEMAVSDTVIRIAVDSLYSPVIDSTYRPGPSIRTNLFYLGSSTPNIGLEFPLGKHVTLGGNFGFKPWPRWSPWDNDKFIEKKWKHILAVPELRIWNKEVYTGPFIGLDGVYTHYNVGAVKFPFGMYKDVRDKRMQGDFIGLGLFTGRSWWLSDHWRLELEAGLAAGYNKADVYECAWCGDLIGEKKGPVIVPKLGLNLAWNLEPRRKEILELIDVICAPLDTLAPPAPVAVPVPFAPLLADVEEWKGVAGTLQKSHPVLRPS